MAVANRELHAVYAAARHGKLGEMCPQVREAAYAADQAYEVINTQISNVPNDDRAENFICEAFALGCTAFGVEWKNLVDIAYLET